MRILIADDDPQILRALRITLGSQGHTIIPAADGAEAISAAVKGHPDLFLIDLGMPRLDGLGVIEGVRGWSQAPILVISGRSESAEKVKALDAGADDYVTKPFSIEELLARIRALTRRVTPEGDEPVISFSEVTVDLAARSVTKGEAPAIEYVHLTPTEWKFLELLVRNPGRLVTRETLLKKIWDSEHVSDSGYLRLYMSQLRKKLETDPKNPRHLMTISGMGYQLEL